MATVRSLLSLLPWLRVLAAAALDREVRWVHISELADPTPHLRGAELVLSAGVHLPRQAGEFHTYARRLAALPAVGLGFGVAPIHVQVPPALVAACEGGEHLGAGVVFASAMGRTAAGAPQPDENALAHVLTRVMDGREEVGAALHDGDVHMSIQPVLRQKRRAALAVARPTALAPLERGIVSIGAPVLSLIERGVPGEAGLHLASALACAVAGEPTAVFEAAVARAFGAQLGQDWRDYRS